MRTFYSEKLGFPKGWNSGAAQSQPGANPSALAPPAVVPPTANSAANDQPPFCERELTGTDWQIDKLIRKSAQINSHVNGNAKLLHDVSLLLPPPQNLVWTNFVRPQLNTPKNIAQTPQSTLVSTCATTEKASTSCTNVQLVKKPPSAYNESLSRKGMVENLDLLTGKRLNFVDDDLIHVSTLAVSLRLLPRSPNSLNF